MEFFFLFLVIYIWISLNLAHTLKQFNKHENDYKTAKQCVASLVPRPFPPPVFDRLQYEYCK